MQVIAIIILARRLGSESFGYFILATTITTYLLLFVQLGLDIIAVRYVSQQQFGLSDLVASILGLRLTVATIVTVGLFIYVFIFGTDDPINRLLLIMSGLYFTNALSLRWPLLAREMMTPLALASFISQFCFFLGALLVLNDSQAAFAALAQVAGEVLAALYVWLAFNARCGHVRPSIDILLMRRLLSETWPIFLSLLLGTMMYNFDIIALRADEQDRGNRRLRGDLSMHHGIFTLPIGDAVEHLSGVLARMAGFFENPAHGDQFVLDIIRRPWGCRIIAMCFREPTAGVALRRGIRIRCAILAGSLMDIAHSRVTDHLSTDCFCMAPTAGRYREFGCSRYHECRPRYPAYPRLWSPRVRGLKPRS